MPFGGRLNTTPLLAGSALGGAHFRVNGIRQHVMRYARQDRESREPASLLVLPGITSPAASWNSVAERLGQRWDTHVLDWRGRGLSSHGKELDYSIDAMAVDLNTYVADRSINEYAFLGHSMGAHVAARATVELGMTPKCTVLVDPPMAGPDRPYPYSLAYFLQSLDEANKGIAGSDLLSAHPQWSDADRQLRAQWLHTCDARAVSCAHQEFHNGRFERDAVRLRVPSLMMSAEHGVCDANLLQRLLEANAGLELCRIDGVGHMIPWDDPEAFLQATETYLSNHMKEAPCR